MPPRRPLSRFPRPACAPLAAALLLAAEGSALAAPCGGLVACSCGDTLTSSWTMTTDLACGNNVTVGLIVNATSAANITLSGGGHSITMSKNNSLAMQVASHTGLTVNNVRFVGGGNTVAGVTLDATSGARIADSIFTGLTNAISMTRTSGTTLHHNTIAGNDTAVIAANLVGFPVNQGLTVTDNDVRSSAVMGMSLRAVDNTLVLTGNDFSGSKEGLNLIGMAGPWALSATNTFVDVGEVDLDNVVRMQNVTNVTVSGLSAGVTLPTSTAYHAGVGLRLFNAHYVTVTNNDFSGHRFGITTGATTGSVNDHGTFVGNDVSDADVWGMELVDWDENLVLGDNDYTDCDNGLRLVNIDPTGASSLVVDLGDSLFDGIGTPDDDDQTGLKVVRSHDVEIVDYEVGFISTGTALAIEDSTDVTVSSMLACGPRLGIELLTGTVVGNGSDGAVLGGAPGDVYVETIPPRSKAKASKANRAVGISAESTGTTIANVIGAGSGVLLEDASPPGSTTGAPTAVGVEGWAFHDADLDTCNDYCGDGTDTDADTYCDPGDFRFEPGALLSSVGWSTGGVGSPSVIDDRSDPTAPYLMIFETQTGPADVNVCPHGQWALGLATSTNGVTWTAAAGPLLAPSPGSGTYHACVAAHPSVVQNGGTTTVFFKAEDESGYRGVGRMLLQWNPGSGTYSITGTDSTPVLTEDLTFGYLHTVFDAVLGRYRFALQKFPSMVVTAGTATLPLDPLSAPVLSPAFASYAPDEVFSPAIACGREDAGWSLFVGGKDLTGPIESPTVVSEGVGRLTSPDFASWTVGPTNALVSTTRASDPGQLRHWDVLPLGATGYVMFYDDKGGAGGRNRIRVAHTGSGTWTAALAATIGDKVCSP